MKAKLGAGIYTLPDVSLILQLPQSRVRRWLNEFWDKKYSSHNQQYSWKVGDSKAIDFLSLIEFYVFFQLRNLGVNAKKIHEANKIMSNEFHTPYPFARSFVLTDGKIIVMKLENGEFVNADKSLQINLKEVIKPFLKKINFGSNQFAEKFWPQGKNSSIVVDPHHQFGQPTILGTNILAETIHSYLL